MLIVYLLPDKCWYSTFWRRESKHSCLHGYTQSADGLHHPVTTTTGSSVFTTPSVTQVLNCVQQWFTEDVCSSGMGGLILCYLMWTVLWLTIGDLSFVSVSHFFSRLFCLTFTNTIHISWRYLFDTQDPFFVFVVCYATYLLALGASILPWN